MKGYRRGIFSQIIICLAVLLLIGDTVLGVLAYNRSKTALFQQIQSNAKNIAQCAAMNVSGDVFSQIEAGDEGSDNYNKVIDELALFRDNAELEYIYTLRKVGEEEVIFVVDADTEEPAAIGDECEWTEALGKTCTELATTADDEAFSDEWGSHLSAYSPILNEGELAGVVGVDISANWIDEQMAKLRNLVLITCIITYFLSMVVILLLIAKFKRSMKKLNDKVKELASGSGDLTKEIDVYSKDELGEIAAHMNEFISQIRNLVKEVVLSSDEILNTGDELGKTIDDNNIIMSNMNSEIDDISMNMEKSVSTSKVMSESLAESSKEIAAFANNVEMICNMVKQANENAQKTVSVARHNRENAMNSISALQESMKKTSKDTQQIMRVNQIAEEISAIASQTRMLSLNAQIEAARAGTMGAGFAVVATQVGSLSDEIDRAVNEINGINTQVQDAVMSLNVVLEDMIRFVSEDVAKDYDSFAALGEEYGETTGTIHIQMTEIGDQSSQISQTIACINEDVQNITKMVSSMADNANDLAKSNEQIAESFERLSTASDNNSEQSEKLSEKVSRYIY